MYTVGIWPIELRCKYKLGSILSSKFNLEETENETTIQLIDQEGLHCGLKTTSTTQNAPTGSSEKEQFLRELE